MDILADKYIIGLYQRMEDEVISDIARRVKKMSRYTETAELMAKFMHEQGYSTEKIQAEVMRRLRADKDLQNEIAENTKAYKKEIQEIIELTVEEGRKSGNALIAEAGNMAWNNDLTMWQQHGVDLKKPNTMSQLITAFRLQTNKELKNLTRSLGFKNTLLGTTGVLDIYQKELDYTLLQVASGTFSFDKAVNDCIHRLAKSGLRSIDYASGRSYQIDTAARMCVRTGMSQLAGKVMEENLKSTDHDLVITSQHMGSRPEHAVWQNKVFSFSGKSKKYPSLREGTGYGNVDGLKGANCTHDFYPFWEGASVIPQDIEYNEKFYKNTQKQRKMERDIRAIKREIEAQNAIGRDATQLQAKRRKMEQEYRKFSKSAGLRPKEDRLRMAHGSSDLKKTKVYKENEHGSSALKKTKTYKDNVQGRGIGKNKRLDDMSLPELKKLAEETAIEYYKSGISGINFGDANIEDVAKKLASQGSKTSLKKDIRSMQKKLEAYIKNDAAKSTNTGKKVSYDPKADYKIELPGYSKQVNESMSKAAKELAKAGSDTGYEHGVFVDLSTGEIGKYVTDNERDSVIPDYRYLKANPSVKVAFLHNHNEDTELSLPDVGLIVNEKGINVVAAVRNDGIITLVESNGKKSSKYLPLEYEEEKKRIQNQMIVDKGYFDVIEGEVKLRDIVIKDYAQEGMRVYGNKI